MGSFLEICRSRTDSPRRDRRRNSVNLGRRGRREGLLHSGLHACIVSRYPGNPLRASDVSLHSGKSFAVAAEVEVTTMTPRLCDWSAFRLRHSAHVHVTIRSILFIPDRVLSFWIFSFLINRFITVAPSLLSSFTDFTGAIDSPRNKSDLSRGGDFCGAPAENGSSSFMTFHVFRHFFIANKDNFTLNGDKRGEFY